MIKEIKFWNLHAFQITRLFKLYENTIMQNLMKIIFKILKITVCNIID